MVLEYKKDGILEARPAPKDANSLKDEHMGKIALLFLATLCVFRTSVAADYVVDFTRTDDLESIRPLVEGCADFDALEIYRGRMQSVANLEEMREIFLGVGLGLFNDCPDSISGAGISLVK